MLRNTQRHTSRYAANLCSIRWSSGIISEKFIVCTGWIHLSRTSIYLFHSHVIYALCVNHVKMMLLGLCVFILCTRMKYWANINEFWRGGFILWNSWFQLGPMCSIWFSPFLSMAFVVPNFRYFWPILNGKPRISWDIFIFNFCTRFFHFMQSSRVFLILIYF